MTSTAARSPSRWVVALAATLAAARAARADDVLDRYRTRFDEGMAHYRRGAFGEAVATWRPIVEALGDEKAYRLLYDLGVALSELGDATAAADAFVRFLAQTSRRPAGEVPPEVQRFAEQARERLATLDASHARLLVVPPPGAAVLLSIDGGPATAAGRLVYLAPGKHALVVRPGSTLEERHALQLTEGSLTRIEARPEPPPPAVTVVVPAEPLPPPPRVEPPFSFAYVGAAAGLTAASAALPMYFYLQARPLEREYADGTTTVDRRREIAPEYSSLRGAYHLSYAVPITLAAGTIALGLYQALGPRRLVSSGAARPPLSLVATF